MHQNTKTDSLCVKPPNPPPLNFRLTDIISASQKCSQYVTVVFLSVAYLCIRIVLCLCTSACLCVCDCGQVSRPGSRLISLALRITGSMNGLFSLPSFSLISDRTSTFLSPSFPNTNNAATHRTTLQKMSLVGYFNPVSMLVQDITNAALF